MKKYLLGILALLVANVAIAYVIAYLHAFYKEEWWYAPTAGVGYVIILSSIFAFAGLFTKLVEVMNDRRTIDGRSGQSMG